MHGIGVVVIARNEGERLRRCFQSLAPAGAPIVYVDSGSTDGSVECARSQSAAVVELDTRRPFTAARARNAGFEALVRGWPHVEYVQFLDGDCELIGNWLERAAQELRSNATYGVVCGRRRERAPSASIYNRLCDIEWNTAVGITDTCGGDAMMRVCAFREVGGYDPTLIAGEEPELCLRLRRRGWTVVRIDADMTVHDAAMMRFGQWWQRAVRAGHAYAERHALHGGPPVRRWRRKNVSIFVSGVLVPLVALSTAPWTGGLSALAPVALYTAQFRRAFGDAARRGVARQDAILYALFCVLAKFPEAQGQVRYWLSRVSRRRASLIEYKGA